MFGKKPPDPTAVLAERVRSLAVRSGLVEASVEKFPRTARRSVFKSATIILDDGTRFTVAIKDVSQGGARIEFFQDLMLEGVFTINEPMTRLRRRARVSWRREGAAGIEFVD